MDQLDKLEVAEADDAAAQAAADNAYDQALAMAKAMYAAIHPELDDKHHEALTVNEMLEWMLNGDTAMISATTVDDMVDEWNNWNNMIAGEE